MGIAIFSRSPVLTVLLAPLQALVALFGPAQPASSSSCLVSAPPPGRSTPDEEQFVIKTIATGARYTTASSQKLCQTVAKAGSPRRLKIVREFEAGMGPSCAGRMVISGRMADVCAELDRMTQREAAAQTA